MIKKKWGIAVISAILIFILSTPIMAATIMGGEDEDDGTSNIIDTTTDNDFVDNAHATLEAKIKEEIKTQLIGIGQNAYIDISSEVYNNQNAILNEIKSAWAQSTNQQISEDNLYDIYYRYSDSVSEYGNKKVDAWINNYYDAYVEVITDKVVEYIDGNESEITNGVATILYTSTENLKEEMTAYVSETRTTLDSVMRKMLPKYSTSIVGWESKAAEAIMLEADIGIKDVADKVLTEAYGWENELLNDAFDQINSYITDVSNEFVDMAINELKGYFGADLSLDIEQIIIDYMLEEILGSFNTTWGTIESIINGKVTNVSPDELQRIEEDLKQTYEEAKALIEQDVEKTGKDFTDNVIQAADEKFSNFGKEFAQHVSNITGEIAASFAMQYYVELQDKIYEITENLGKIGQSVIDAITYQVGDWLYENISTNVSTLIMNSFFGGNGEFNLTDFDITWESFGAQVLLNWLSSNEEINEILNIFIEGYGGVTSGYHTFERYVGRTYNFIIKGGVLIPTTSSASANATAIAGALASVSIGDVGAFGQAEAGMGYHSLQFNPLGDTQTICNYYRLIIEGPTPKPIPSTPLMNRPGIIALETTSYTEPRWWPSGSAVWSVSDPRYADTEYIVNEMVNNQGGDSYVQRAFSLSTLALEVGNGNPFSPSLLSKELWTEAQKYRLFRAECTARLGYYNGISDETEDATSRYMEDIGAFVVGPFKVDYIKSTIQQPHREKVHFGFMEDMEVYYRDANGEEQKLSDGSWMILFEENSEFDFSSERYLDDYQLPYPNEEFYIMIMQDMNSEVTSISKIEMKFKEMVTVLRGQKLNMQTTQMVNINLPPTVVPMGPHHPPKYIWNTKRINMTRITSNMGFSVLFTSKQYVSHTYEIKLSKKDPKTPAYETADYVTSGSIVSSEVEEDGVIYGSEINSSLYNSLSKLVENTESNKSDYNSSGSTFDESLNKISNIYTSADGDTKYISAVNSILKAIAENDATKSLSILGNIFGSSNGDFQKVTRLSKLVSENEKVRELATVIETAIEIYKNTNDNLGVELLNLLNETTIIYNNVDYSKVMDSINQTINNCEYKIPVFALLSQMGEGELTNEKMGTYLQTNYSWLDEDKRGLVMNTVKAIVSTLNNTGDLGNAISQIIQKAYKMYERQVTMSELIKTIVDYSGDEELQNEYRTFESTMQINQAVSTINSDSLLTPAEKYRYIQEEQIKIFKATSVAAKELDNGKDLIDAIERAYSESSNIEVQILTKFQTLVKDLTETDITNLTASLVKSQDVENTLDIINTELARNNLKGESEKAQTFIDILEANASLYDRTAYAEYNSDFNITKVERPSDLYYMGDDEIDLTMTIAGVVWKDGHSGLQNDYDGVRTANTNGDIETGIEGVEVRLRRVDNGQIGRMRQNNKWVEAITYTDDGGYYHFEEVESAKYYVEFVYDGHKYMPTTSLSNGETRESIATYKQTPDQEVFDNNSKAAEVESDRIAFNDKFHTINGDTAYTKDGQPLTVNGNVVNLEYEQKDGTSSLITLDNAGHVLPQYAMVASSQTLGITYPIDTSVTLDNETTESLTSAYGQQDVISNEYIKTGEYMYHVNLGLVERTKLDLALTQDVYNVTTTVNEKQEDYIYNQRGSLSIFDAKLKNTDAYKGINYTRELYNADYQLRLEDYQSNSLNRLDRNGNDKSSEIEKIKELKEIEYSKGGLEQRAFVTYKITLKNQSLLQSATINELTDYFDPSYNLVTEDTYQEIQNAEGIVENKLVAKQSYFIVQSDNSATEYKLLWEETGMSNGLKTMNTVQTDGIGLEDVIMNAQDEIYVFVTFEVAKDENRAISLGKKENIVEISSYTSLEIGTTSKEHSIGLIDKDSAPDSISVGQTNTYEDDTDAAPIIDFKLYSTDLRNINGYVWNDDRDVTLSTGQVVGNGVREEDEELINGVRVQLVEVITDPATGAEYEYVWKEMYTGEDNYRHIGSSGSLANTERGQTISTGSVISDTNLGAVQKGEYKFHDFIAGNFIVRFIYGDTYRTYLAAGSENSEGEGLNEASYNGHDYKSTAYLKGNNLYAKWYDLSGFDKEDKLYSDAKDDTTRRNVVIDYASTLQNDKAEILASFDDRDDKFYYERQLHQTARDNTWMFADTAKINMNVEYNKTEANGLQTQNYKIKNMDLGLEKRPETKIELTKEITDIKITLASGNTIINTAAGMTQNVNWIDNKKDKVEGHEYKRDTLRYEYRQGRIHIYMDEEVMQGATIQVTFKITVTNNSEIDYTGQNGNLGYAYFTGQVSSSDKIVTTTVDKIIDYVDNSLTFRKVDSPEWSLIETMREFTTTSEGSQVEIERMDYGTYIETMMERYGEDYVAEHLREFEAQYQVYKETGRLEGIGNIGGNTSNNVDEEENTVGNHLSNYNVIQNMKNRENGIAYLNEDLQIVKTKSAQTKEEPITQVIVTKALEDVELKPGESASVDLVLSKTLSPEDEDDTLNYGNLAEILQYSNTVGRRDMDAVPGNQQPDEDPYEYDTDYTERIIITPPTGANRALFIVLPLTILAILGGGIILIKKKVINKRF